MSKRSLRKLHSSVFDYFVAVATEGSFRGAARRLRVASSAINRHVLLLEEELGFVLFERGARALKLTSAGEILLGHCTDTMRRFEDTLEALDALRELRSGVVRLAASESFAAEIVPRICAAFSQAYPAVQLHVTVSESNAVIRAVERHEADVGFAFATSDIASARLIAGFALRIGAVVGPLHPLAGRKRVSTRECSAHALVVPDPALSFRRRIDEVSDLFTRRRSPGIEASSPRLMLGIARMNGHIAFQTEVGLGTDLANRSLVFLPLTDRALSPDRCLIIASQRSAGRFAAEKFCSHAADALKGFLDRDSKGKQTVRRGYTASDPSHPA